MRHRFDACVGFAVLRLPAEYFSPLQMPAHDNQCWCSQSILVSDTSWKLRNSQWKLYTLAGSRRWFGLRRRRAAEVCLPTGIRHCKESSQLQPGCDKRERETLWHITHALSVLLGKNFNAGAARYAAGEH